MSEDAAVTATPMRERTAEEIRVLLARRRISGAELARRIGATQPYISRRLTGEIAFDVDDLEKIARVLGVSAGTLLPGAVTPEYSRLAERWTATARPPRKIGRPAHNRPAAKTAGPPNVGEDSRRPVLLARRITP